MSANSYPPNTGQYNTYSDRVDIMKKSRVNYTPQQIAAAEQDRDLYRRRSGPYAVNTKDNMRSLNSDIEFAAYTRYNSGRGLSGNNLTTEYGEYTESGSPEVNIPDNFDELVAAETNTNTGGTPRSRTRTRSRARARKRTRARSRARARKRTRTRAHRLR
jgi:hypothetical protein